VLSVSAPLVLVATFACADDSVAYDDDLTDKKVRVRPLKDGISNDADTVCRTLNSGIRSRVICIHEQRDTLSLELFLEEAVETVGLESDVAWVGKVQEITIAHDGMHACKSRSAVAGCKLRDQSP
jgi:hypothetical protein